MECLDESTVLVLLEGRLPASEAERRRGHLAECDACRALVSNVAKAIRSEVGGTDDTSLASTEIAWGSSGSDPDFQAHFAPGTVLDGRYRIERLLGSGGMGAVALATHTGLGQQVAIKLLHPRALASPEAVGRFVREAKAAVRAFGDHVVRVLDVARLATGEPYIAMELLVGKDARVLREARAPSIEEIVELVAQASIGVAHAHRAGIVHRDLKPANLFVIDDPTRDPPMLVKVLDFGVSKVRRDDFGEDAALTRSSAFLGTPLYMAPEQIRTARDVDARADVWAFGCILHELVTGDAPFRRPSLGETCAAILVEEPPKLPASVPRAVVAIVARCLSKDPTRRYADGAELAGALAPLCSAGTRDEIRRTLGVDAQPAKAGATRGMGIAIAIAVASALTGGAIIWRKTAVSAPLPTVPSAVASAPAAASASAPSAPIEPSASAKTAAPSAAFVASPRTKPAPLPPAPTQAPSASVTAPTTAAPPPPPSTSVINPEFGERN